MKSDCGAATYFGQQKAAVTKWNIANCLPHRLHSGKWETNLETTYRNFQVRHFSDQCQTKEKKKTYKFHVTTKQIQKYFYIMHDKWHQLHKKQDIDKYMHQKYNTTTYNNTYKDEHHIRHCKKMKIFYIIIECITISSKRFPTKITIHLYSIYCKRST